MREFGEEEIVRFIDRLVANTDEERRELIDRVRGRPAPRGCRASGCRSQRLHLPDASVANEPLIVFAGRIQPLKAPDIVIKAAARLMADVPRLRVAVVGGASGSGLDRPTELAGLAPCSASATASTSCRRSISVASHTGSVAPRWSACPPTTSPSGWSRWRHRLAVPQSLPRRSGLPTAVVDGVSGTLVDGHSPADFAAAMAPILLDSQVRAAMSVKALAHAGTFGWARTAALLDADEHAVADRKAGRKQGRDVNQSARESLPRSWKLLKPETLLIVSSATT